MIDKNIFLSNLLNRFIIPKPIFQRLTCDGNISQNPVFYFTSVTERFCRALTDYALVTFEEAMALCELQQIAYSVEGTAPNRRFRMGFEDLVVVCSEGDGLLTLYPNEQMAWMLTGMEDVLTDRSVATEKGVLRTRLSKPGLVPSPEDMTHHADLIRRHGERLLSLIPAGVIEMMERDARLYLGIAQSLYRYLEENDILAANERHLRARIKLMLSEDSRNFTLGCEGRHFGPAISSPVEQMEVGFERFALRLIEYIREKVVKALQDCQQRADLAVNAVTKQYEVSWAAVEDHTSSSGDYATIVLCRIFDKVYYHPINYLGRYIKDLHGWNWFEEEGQSKIPALRHYKNFYMDYDYEAKTMVLTFKARVVEYLQLNHSSLRYAQNPYPSVNDLHNYDEYLSRHIKQKEAAEALSRHPKYPLVEQLVRAVLADVYPLLGVEDSTYRLTVKIVDTSLLEVKLSDCHREMQYDGGCGPLVMRFDLKRGSLEGWCDDWRVAFKRWSVLELKDAKYALLECRRCLDWADGMVDGVRV